MCEPQSNIHKEKENLKRNQKEILELSSIKKGNEKLT